MRVCCVIGSASRLAYGMLPSAVGSAKGLRRLGHEVQVVTGWDACLPHDLAAWERVPVHALQQLGPRNFHFAPLLFRWLAEQQPFDVMLLHGLWVSMHAQAFNYARRRGIPIILATHGMLSPWALTRSSFKKSVARALFANRLLDGCACFWASSAGEAEEVARHGFKAPVAVVPHGVDAPSEPGAHPGSRKLVFLGRLHTIKGIELLVDAWRMLGAEVAGWKLIVAGPDELGMRSALEQKLTHGNVEFVGPVFGEDKDRLLRMADTLILPSLSEGLPVTVLEAWSYGKPVVMTAECNLNIGFERRAALHVEASASGIAAGLRRLFATTPEERAEMGANGRALVEAEYSWDRAARQLDDVLQWLRVGAAQPACFGSLARSAVR